MTAYQRGERAADETDDEPLLADPYRPLLSAFGGLDVGGEHFATPAINNVVEIDLSPIGVPLLKIVDATRVRFGDRQCKATNRRHEGSITDD